MTLGRDALGRLERWLAVHAALGPRCRIVETATPRTGFSADTLLLTVETGGAAGPRGIVVRIADPARAIFLDASITRQARMMRALASRGVAVPALLGSDEDPSVLGAPFLVMERRAGTPLPQHPSYHVAGLLIGLDEAGRDRAWRQALGTIAAINRLDWREDFAFLADPAHGAPGLDHYLGWIRAWRRQACDAFHPVIDPALEWLERRRPAAAPAELLWGDSNPGNFLFAADGSVAAALDFEAASLGPAEIDLAWWFVLDRMLAAGQALPPGMPDRDAQIAIYQRALGRKVADLEYFEVLAAVKMSLVVARSVRLLIAAGRLEQDNRAGIANPVASMLAGMIGIDHDPGLGDYMRLVGVMNRR